MRASIVERFKMLSVELRRIKPFWSTLTTIGVLARPMAYGILHQRTVQMTKIRVEMMNTALGDARAWRQQWGPSTTEQYTER